MSTPKYERLQTRLGKIHNRINELVEIEVRAVLVGGYEAKDELQPIKDNLLVDAERIVDQLLSY